MTLVRRIERVIVGPTEVIALVDGAHDFIPITEAFPDADVEELLAYRADHADLHGPNDEWHLIVRAWVLRHPGGVVLVDTGVGSTVAAKWFGVEGKLMGLLKEVGIDESEIHIVVITHVHDDHIGGTVTREGTVSFPNARHLMQRADWEWAHRSAKADGVSEGDRVIWERLLLPLQSADVLQLVEGDFSLTSEILLRHVPGHTPGHQVVQVNDEGRCLLIASDAFNHPGQLSHPDWSNAADQEPSVASVSRRMILEELAARPETIVAPTHFVEAFGTVETNDAGRWAPLVPRPGA